MAINQLESASLYTDFSGLAELRRGAKENNPEAIKAVAQQFEAIFVQMMMKSMRDAKLADGLFDNDQTDQYLDLHDKQLATTLSSQGKGIGLAEVIARQLSGAAQPSELSNDGAVQNIPARLPSMFKLQEAIREKNRESAEFNKLEIVDKAQDASRLTSKNSPNISATKELNDPLMNTQDDFIKQLWPMAEKAAASLGVSPKAILAQAALETGWGRAVIRNRDGSNSFNLFNIKSGHGWNGDSVMKSSLEFYDGVAKQERSAFRSYAGYEDSFNDYVDFLKSNPRYQQALEQSDTPESYLRGLQKAGYATDPHYADKVESIMNRSRFVASINTVASNTTTNTSSISHNL